MSELVLREELGGAAVLAAAPHVPEATAVVTIAAPSSAAHRSTAAHVLVVSLRLASSARCGSLM